MAWRNKNSYILLAIIAIAVIFAVYIITNPFIVTWELEKKVKQQENFPAMVIKCEYRSLDMNEFLDYDEFELSDSLTYIAFLILDSTEEIEIESIEIFHPGEDSGKTYYTGKMTDNPPYPGGYYVKYISDNHIQLDKEGIWRIKLDLNESAAVYQYSGSTDTFSDSSVVKFLEDEITTFRVLSTSDVERRDGEEESPWDIFISNIGLIVTLIIGIPGLSISLMTYIYKRRKERKPDIINVITNVIDNDVARELDWLNNTTIVGLENGRFRDVPDFITENVLNDARWRDFEDEYEDIYSELENYVEIKVRYRAEYEQLNESIISALNDLRNQNPVINTRIQEMRDGRSESHVPLDVYYESQIEHGFVLVIRENQNTLRHRGRRALVAEFEDELLAIRNNPGVRRHLDSLQGYLDDLREVSTLLEDIRDNKRDRLRRKYHISHGELGDNNN